MKAVLPAAARPLLDVVGSTVVHVGPSGAGQTVKAANQLIVAGNIALLAEAIEFLRAHGADLDAVVRVLGGGLAGRSVGGRGPRGGPRAARREKDRPCDPRSRSHQPEYFSTAERL